MFCRCLCTDGEDDSGSTSSSGLTVSSTQEIVYDISMTIAMGVREISVMHQPVVRRQKRRSECSLITRTDVGRVSSFNRNCSHVFPSHSSSSSLCVSDSPSDGNACTASHHQREIVVWCSSCVRERVCGWCRGSHSRGSRQQKPEEKSLVAEMLIRCLVLLLSFFSRFLS